ncbi:hypothetical protein [Bacillus sp. JCM 19041]|uniref:hypothetical protein n=1 Tax=Bacillus sp. JCM 19041 TaxID=1460637 RepID=UPI000A8D8FD6
MKKWSIALASVIFLSSTAFIGINSNESDVTELDGKQDFHNLSISTKGEHDFH